MSADSQIREIKMLLRKTERLTAENAALRSRLDAVTDERETTVAELRSQLKHQCELNDAAAESVRRELEGGGR